MGHEGSKRGHLQAVRSLRIRASVGKGGEGMVSFCLREIGQIRYWAVSSAALSLLPITAVLKSSEARQQGESGAWPPD